MPTSRAVACMLHHCARSCSKEKGKMTVDNNRIVDDAYLDTVIGDGDVNLFVDSFSKQKFEIPYAA